MFVPWVLAVCMVGRGGGATDGNRIALLYEDNSLTLACYSRLHLDEGNLSNST